MGNHSLNAQLATGAIFREASNLQISNFEWKIGVCHQFPFYNEVMVDPGVQPANVEEAVLRTNLPRRVVLVLAYIDARALGLSLGIICGLWICLLTIASHLHGNSRAWVSLALLSQYFPGFRISYTGSLVGFVYACICGFIVGYLFARIRNCLVHSYITFLRRRGEQQAVSDLLDHLM
jgi:hypothetical protein